MKKENRSMLVGSVLVFLVIGIILLLNFLVPQAKETIYTEIAPQKDCVDFACASWFEQGSTMLFRIDSTTWKTKCDLSTQIFHGTKDIAVPTLKIYKTSPSPLQTVAIIEGERFDFYDENKRTSQTIRWNIPKSAPSGVYRVVEAIYCYTDATFEGGRTLTGKILSYDNVFQTSTESTGYFRVSKEEPCLLRSSRCEGNKWKECAKGDSYNGFAWKDPRPVKGKCGVDCITSNDCGAEQKCDSSFKCVEICQPRFDKLCKDVAIYERNSCTGEETYKKTCDYDCISGECIRMPEPEPVEEPECPTLGVKPCDDAVKTRFAGCDVWDDLNCQIDTKCSEGDVEEEMCADGNKIVASQCIGGEMLRIESMCPQIECRFNSDCSEGYKCVDGGKCEKDEVEVKEEKEIPLWVFIVIPIFVVGILLIALLFLVLSKKKE